ncbi:MAG: RNA 2',3'-cyclic phosphodiesterase [Gammaproteobacteria bacterium]
MPRLYFALWPDTRARAELQRAAEAVDVREGRRVRPENLHLTVLFLGSVGAGPAAALADLDLGPAPPVVCLEFGISGWWRSSGVAWLAPFETPPALAELHERVGRAVTALGLEPEKRRFRPHVTVARAVRRAPRTTGEVACRWVARRMCLVESFTEPAGARYEIRREWALAGPGDD